MAGIIHEVERTDLLEQVRQEAADAARQLAGLCFRSYSTRST